MPKRTDIHKILIIGAGPIVIGQACEFDYSGTQACKALREEGFVVVLVNSNPATIMTDPDMADRTYIEPITAGVIEQVLAVEKPDAVLPTMGGQTALNVALELASEWRRLARHGCVLIGADAETIRKAEDRELFKHCMEEIGLESARSALAHNLDDARAGAEPGWIAVRAAAELHAGGLRGRYRLQPRGIRPHGRDGNRAQPDPFGVDRREHHRLERVRDGGDARLRRQLRDRVLDREL